jgi:hypothetical protein
MKRVIHHHKKVNKHSTTERQQPVPTMQQVVSPGGFAMSLSGLRV